MCGLLMADGTNDSMPSPLSPQVSCRIFSSAKCPEVQRPTTVPGMPQPACICLLACLCLQANDADKYWQFSKLNHELSKNITLRGMLRFKPSPTGVCLGGGAGVGVPSLQVSHVLPSLLTACAPSEASHSMHAQHMQMHVSLCFSPLLACAVPTACLLFAMFFNLLTRLLSMHMCPVPPPLHRPCPSGGGGACCV